MNEKPRNLLARLPRAVSHRLVDGAAVELRRLAHTHATPHEIALGCATGVFAAFTPFIGFQMLLAVALACILRVNIPAALVGTFAGNPLSWPAIWAASYVAGSWVLGVDPGVAAEQVTESAAAIARAAADQPNKAGLGAAASILAPHFKPWLIGSMLVGLIAAAVSYYPTRRVVGVFQRGRRPN